jgi:hypothetical protein
LLTAALHDVVRKLAHRCAHAALAVTAATLVIVVLAAVYLAQNLQVDTNLDELIDPDAPFRERQRALNAAFPEQDDRLVLVVSGGAPDARLAATTTLAERLRARDEIVRAVFAPAVMPFFVKNGILFDDLATLERRLDRLAEAQPLLAALARDPTPARLTELLAAGFEQDDPPPELLAAADRLAPAFTAAAAARTRPIAWLDLAEFTAAGGSSFVIEITPVLDFERVRPGARALTAVRALADEIEASHAGVEVAMTGEVALEAEELEAAGTGAASAGLLSLALVTLVLVWSLRSAGAIASVLATLLAGLVLTGAFAMWAIGAFTMISIAFAVLFIGLGVDFAIHVVLRAQEEAGLGRSWRTAVAKGAGATGPALMLCAPTTALAFLAFTPTGYVGLAELGVIAAAGILIALALSLTFLPALLVLTAGPRRLPPAPWPHGAPRMRRVAAGLVVALGLLSLAGAGSLRFDGDPLALKDPEAPSVVAFRQLLDSPTRSPYRAQLLVPDADAAARAAERLGHVPAVGPVVRLASFVPAAQDAKLALIDDARLFLDLPAYTPPAPTDTERLARALARLAAAAPAGELADAARAIARRIERTPELAADLGETWFRWWPQALARTRALLDAGPVTAATLPPELVDRYVAADGRHKLDVLPAEPLETAADRRDFVEAVLAAAPDAAGNVVQMVRAGELVAGAMVEATLYALAGVTLVVAVVLRRPGEVVGVLGAVLLAAALTVGAMEIFDLAFNFANVIVLPLLLGVGVDAAIHVVMRARETSNPAIVGATSTPRAVFASALTTVASFGTLMLSPHAGTASMGLLLTLAVSASLVTVLVVLPVWLERRTR